MSKFQKNRGVLEAYWKVPIKYCFEVPHSKNREFVIMDFMGRNLICAWRNENTGRIGIPFLCKKTFKNSKLGFIYKDKFYNLETNSGWVF